MKAAAFVVMAVSSLVTSSFAPAQNEPLTLVGWGLASKDLDTFMAQAADVGFDALITGSLDPQFLAQAVQAGARHNIRIFTHISPTGHLKSAWTAAYPGQPIPWQVLSEEEQAVASFISAGRNIYLIPYQWGGEPIMTNEVLTTPTVCFSSLEARALLERMIGTIASVPGLEGLGFDGFGYQNYHRCYCERCQRLFEEFMRARPELSEEEASVEFFRDMLVGYINHLAHYARAKRPDIRTTIHIWPVFAPEPLYGNRLDVDFCGQTAAWYTLWPQEKIAEYSRIICEDARRYHERQTGVGMIGYYDRPGEFPIKDAAQVEMELSTMIGNGCRRIQVCSTIHVINNEEIAGVFRRHFAE